MAPSSDTSQGISWIYMDIFSYQEGLEKGARLSYLSMKKKRNALRTMTLFLLTKGSTTLRRIGSFWWKRKVIGVR